MQLIRFKSPDDFYSEVHQYLLEHEVVHSLPLGLIQHISKGRFDQPAYMALIEDDGILRGVAMRTPPHGVVLSRLVMPCERLFHLLINDLFDLYGADLPGVLGEKSDSRAFAQMWSARAGVASRLVMEQRIYRLDVVKPPTGVAGVMRPVAPAERDTLIAWIIGFSAITANGEMSHTEAAKRIDHYLNAPEPFGQLFVWESDGEPVSMTACTRSTDNSATVSLVYTPPEHRRKGYAGALVAAVSQHILDNGKSMACLFTDLSNPTSNHIYQAIGYRQVADFDQYYFGTTWA